MSYHLLNIEASVSYYCDEDEWIRTIETAKENGWKPDGTLYDYVYVAEEESFDIDDELYCMYMMIIAKDEYFEWDGNYIEKQNQIVMYEDTLYLAAALENSGIDDKLLDFIKKGSFRICS
ncbi:MAG: hypothetical protein FWF73_04030 [Spirochaetes bacterium]|nr:hypothetical protein [Spirochaetota bacterium]